MVPMHLVQVRVWPPKAFWKTVPIDGLHLKLKLIVYNDWELVNIIHVFTKISIANNMKLGKCVISDECSKLVALHITQDT